MPESQENLEALTPLTGQHHLAVVTTRAQSRNKVNSSPTTQKKDKDVTSEEITSDDNEADESEPSNSKDNAKELSEEREKSEVIREYHSNPLGGHQGVEKTYRKIRRKFKWKGMVNDVKRYIKQCATCQKVKTGKMKKAPMVIPDVAKKPSEKVYIDIVGPLTPSNNGNRYILSFVDDLTRYMECVAIPDMEANTVAKAFFEEIICKYGIPAKVITDQGTYFESEVFKKCCKLLKIDKLRITVFHPQSNGILERAHKPLVDYLRCFVDTAPNT